MKTLHLLYAITGSIDSNVIVGETLSDLSLSHNSLTGTIQSSYSVSFLVESGSVLQQVTRWIVSLLPPWLTMPHWSLSQQTLSVIPHTLKHAATMTYWMATCGSVTLIHSTT